MSLNQIEAPSGDSSPLSEPEQPRHFNLIWDHELPALRSIFEAVAHNRDKVLDHWHRLYLLHLGESRSLPDRVFYDVFGAELDAITDAILHQDLERFAEVVRKTGERLRDERVPFAELSVSMHLFEESVLTAFPHSAPLLVQVYRSFDKLSHCRMIVIAETYFNSESAARGARIRGLENEASRIATEHRTAFRGMIGASAAMRRLYQRIEMAAKTHGILFIVGESGTGKELVAHAIHECGIDPESSFVALNCAALPKDLIESELFGYKRGAFSGARENYLGLFRAAEGGTLFLDEITEMSPDVQSKLLRALQERTVRPVGSEREVAVNARVIASTNLDPERAVQNGALRADLYYRLQASVLEVPPLRERGDDIGLLVDHFLKLFNQKSTRSEPITAVTDDALGALKHYSWPGNVRELANAIESAVTFGRGPAITAADLPAAIFRSPSPEELAARATHPFDSVAGASSVTVPTFAEVERELVARALQMTEGNRSRAAKLLKISRKKLYDKIAKYDLH